MAFDKKMFEEYIETPKGKARIYRVDKIDEYGLGKYENLPYSIRVVLENLVRNHDDFVVRDEEVQAAAKWEENAGKKDIPLFPTRVIMQDFTGVPAVVDLAAMRDALKDFNRDPSVLNPLIPVHLIIDHSVQVDYFGTSYALFW
ncbi:MAG: aconitate hydratase, partial [Desulfurococcales archaeon]|nr:aconitate hydratase [Desulfurococcales archaeon]